MSFYFDQTLQSVEAADMEQVGDILSEPFEILKAGVFKKDGKDLIITEEDLTTAVDNFSALAATGIEVPIDYDHNSATGKGSKAAGWIKELSKKGQSLYARAVWTPQAKEKIASGEYRRFSSEISPNYTDQDTGEMLGFTIVAGALTNRPFLRRLSPVRLSDEQELHDLREKLTLLEEEVAKNKSQLSEISTDVQKATTEKEVTTMEDTITLSQEEHATLLESVEKNKVLSEKVELLSERLEEISKVAEKATSELFSERLSRVLEGARREGRIDAKDETTTKWTQRAEKFGLDEVTEMLSELPTNTIPVAEVGHGENKVTQATTKLSSFEGVEDGEFAVDEAAMLLHERALEIQREKNVSYSQALRMVNS